MTDPRYTTTPANGGEKTVLLEGCFVRAVFVEAGHAELAEKVARLLNEAESREKLQASSPV